MTDSRCAAICRQVESDGWGTAWANEVDEIYGLRFVRGNDGRRGDSLNVVVSRDEPTAQVSVHSDSFWQALTFSLVRGREPRLGDAPTNEKQTKRISVQQLQ